MSNRGVRKKVRLVSNRKSKPEIFEGVRAEEYKKLRNKWIRLAVVGTGLPFILGILISIFNDTFSILDLFGNGEIILLLFSLNLPMAFDLFDIKHCDDETLSWAFWLCVIIICLQIALYCLIRTNNSESGKVKSIIASICMMGASKITCGFSIKAIFQHSITEDGGEENSARYY